MQALAAGKVVENPPYHVLFFLVDGMNLTVVFRLPSFVEFQFPHGFNSIAVDIFSGAKAAQFLPFESPFGFLA